MRYSFLVLVLIVSRAEAVPRLELVGNSDAFTVHVRGAASGATSGTPYFTATWRLAPERAELLFEQRRTDADGANVRVAALLETGIMAYIDGRIRFTKQGTQCVLPASALLSDMDHMVQATTAVFTNTGNFHGFSEATATQLEHLIAMDWSNIRNGIYAAGEQDKYMVIYRFLRQQQEAFAAVLRADLGSLSNVVVWGDPPLDLPLPPSMPTICGSVFDSNEFLCALDLSAAGDASTVDVQLDPGTFVALLDPLPTTMGKGDRGLTEQVALLKERLDRLEAVQSELLLARLEDVELAIEDLRLELRSAMTGYGGSEGPLATVRFDRNSDALGLEQQNVLDAVLDELPSDEERHIRITGFADRTGDPVSNLGLSERRALAVRAYLMQQGLPAERLEVVPAGDRSSTGPDPVERRVEVSWAR